MSSDNYYTIKFNKDTARWHLVHGFMSTLEDGWPATIREDNTGFESYNAAFEHYKSLDHYFMGNGYSEYGLIEEDYPLNMLVTDEQARAWAEERVRTLSYYLNPEGDE